MMIEAFYCATFLILGRRKAVCFVKGEAAMPQTVTLCDQRFITICACSPRPHLLLYTVRLLRLKWKLYSKVHSLVSAEGFT